MSKFRDALLAWTIVFIFPAWMMAAGMTATSWKWPWVFIAPIYACVMLFFLFLTITLPLAMVGFVQSCARTGKA